MVTLLTAAFQRLADGIDVRDLVGQGFIDGLCQLAGAIVIE